MEEGQERRKPKRGGRLSKAEQTLIQQRRAKALHWSTRGRTAARIVAMSQAENWEPWPYASEQSVYDDIGAALKEAKKVRNARAGEWIEQENLKLDALEEVGWEVMEALHLVVNQGEVVYVYEDEMPELIKQGWARPKLDEKSAGALRKAASQLKREPLRDNKPKLDAMLALLKVHERRTKLNGTDAPIKKQIDVTSGGNVLDDRITEVFRRLEDLARGGQGEAPPGGVAPAGGSRAEDTGGSG
jgi:hypothetical protein